MEALGEVTERQRRGQAAGEGGEKRDIMHGASA
jgi:hypothetical protein